MHSHQKKDISLSPLSKRMAAQASGGVSTSMSLSSTKNQFSQPFYLANQSSTDLPTTSNILRNPNDFRVSFATFQKCNLKLKKTITIEAGR